MKILSFNTTLKTIGLILYFIAMMLASGITMRNLIAYNATISESIGYYLTLPYFKVKRNQLYLINIPKHYMKIAKKLGYHANSNTLLKQVIGMPNDNINITKKGIYLNNKLLPYSIADVKARDINLEPLPVGYKYKLQANEYWVIGNTLHSFDSRYFGVIKINQIVKQAIFLFN